jgi:hypothetical protein
MSTDGNKSTSQQRESDKNQQREDDKNEALQHEWTTLRTLWEQTKLSDPAPSQSSIKAVEALFTKQACQTGGDAWNALNAAEQRVGILLSPAQLKVEFAGLLATAKARAAPDLAVHEANVPLINDDKADMEARHAAYLSLLYSLQSTFISTRLHRRLRLEVAKRLAIYGAGLLLLVAIPLLPVLINRPPVNDISIAVLVLVAMLGMLGAYFSRVLSFNATLASLSFDDVMKGYVGRMLRIRLIYGMIGALVFYFLLRGGIVAGSVFPAFEVARGSGNAMPPGTDPRTMLGLLAPDADFAKLLVWSFIAGFSERLVGDAISRAESQANRSGHKDHARPHPRRGRARSRPAPDAPRRAGAPRRRSRARRPLSALWRRLPGPPRR